MNQLVRWYEGFSKAASWLQSPLLLAIRLYWGWQFMQTGWGKLHNMPHVTEFFISLNIPYPSFSAHLCASVEFVGGILLILGLATRFAGLLLTVNMFVAYWTADRDALHAILSKPEKFYGADPYTFLFAAVIALVFGAGLFSVDAVLRRALVGNRD